jgi:hypothetical protein
MSSLETAAHDYLALNDRDDVICPLTLVESSDNVLYADWINIPTKQGFVQSYLINGAGGFGKYFDLYNEQKLPIPDPLRNYDNLKFMERRLIRLMRLKKTYNYSVITDEFKRDKLAECLIRWNENISTDREVTICISLVDFIKNNLLYSLNIDTGAAELAQRNNAVGAWLLRNSSAVNELGEFSIFTLQYTDHVMRNILNIRFLDLHGVGIYPLTSTDEKLKKFKISSETLKNGSKKDILIALDYMPPMYACIIDMLEHVHEIGLIKLGMFVRPIIEAAHD